MPTKKPAALSSRQSTRKVAATSATAKKTSKPDASSKAPSSKQKSSAAGKSLESPQVRRGKAEPTKDTLQAATPATGDSKAHSGYVPSEVQGHAVRLPEAVDKSGVKVIDLTTGELYDSHPGELVLRDDTERYYSHSFIKTLASCAAQAYYRKMGIKMVPAFALERGSAIHAGAEKFIKTNGDTEAARKALTDSWRELVLDKKAQMSEADQEKIGYGWTETQLMLEEFMLENGELIRSSRRNESEVEFSTIVTMNTPQGSFRRRIYGKIDWIVWTADEKQYMIFDFKSSKNVPSDDELDRDVQFALYQHAAEEKYGFPPRGVYYYYLKGKHTCINSQGDCRTCQKAIADNTGKYRCPVDEHNRSVKFSKNHPRPTTTVGLADHLQFQFMIEPYTIEKRQMMFDTYYSPLIMKWEAGLIEKRLDDPRKCLTMCGYREYCDTVKSFPLPRFARVESD